MGATDRHGCEHARIASQLTTNAIERKISEGLRGPRCDQSPDSMIHLSTGVPAIASMMHHSKTTLTQPPERQLPNGHEYRLDTRGGGVESFTEPLSNRSIVCALRPHQFIKRNLGRRTLFDLCDAVKIRDLAGMRIHIVFETTPLASVEPNKAQLPWLDIDAVQTFVVRGPRSRFQSKRNTFS
jgi:hypothetical protein